MKMNATIQHLNIDILVSTCMYIAFESLKSKKKRFGKLTHVALLTIIYQLKMPYV